MIVIKGTFKTEKLYEEENLSKEMKKTSKAYFSKLKTNGFAKVCLFDSRKIQELKKKIPTTLGCPQQCATRTKRKNNIPGDND